MNNFCVFAIDTCNPSAKARLLHVTPRTDKKHSLSNKNLIFVVVVIVVVIVLRYSYFITPYDIHVHICSGNEQNNTVYCPFLKS